MLILILIGTIFQQEEDPFQVGLKILREQGPAEAVVYFEDLVSLRDDPKSFFYLGWSLWEEGHTEEAEFMAKVLLDKEVDGRILGHANYLLGLIENDRFNPEAIGFFEKAIKYYSEVEANGSLYRAHCGIAAALIFQEEFHKATTLLNKALVYRKKSKKKSDNTAYYYDLLSRAFFGLGDYETALETAKEALKVYEKLGNTIAQTHTLSSIAFYEILSGRAEDGVERSKDIDDIIRSNEEAYKKLSFYHAINWVIILRCAEKDYSHYEESIRAYLDENDDQLLKKHLIFGLEWNCGG